MREDNEYYAEDTFTDVKKASRVYTGPLTWIGLGGVVGCFGISMLCKNSHNMSFLWLQRRVGFQIGTLAYFITTNLLYTHDGTRWKMNDVGEKAKSVLGPIYADLRRLVDRQ